MDGMALATRLLALALAVGLSGCGAMALPRPFALSRADEDWAQVFEVRKGRRFLPWAEVEPLLIVVDKDERALSLFERGREVRVYPVVLGREKGRKLYEGDRKTPTGIYRITRKRPHRRFYRFLDFDYPSAEDLELYHRAVASGEVPKKGGAPRSPGDLLGIHGSDQEELNRTGVNWTYGCVALMNRHVEELYEKVPEGTLVLIRGGIE